MSPPKPVGAFLFFLNLGRVEGFGFDGKGRRAKREPEDVDYVLWFFSKYCLDNMMVQQHRMIFRMRAKDKNEE